MSWACDVICSDTKTIASQKHPFAYLSRTSNNDKRCRALPGGLLRGGLVDCYTFATKNSFATDCYKDEIGLKSINTWNLEIYLTITRDS